MDLYIYYRVRSDNAHQLRECVCKMQAQLTEKYGIATELKRRPEIKNAAHTWMEVYRQIPDDFEAILQQALIETELSALIDGERRAEHFLDFSSCA